MTESVEKLKTMLEELIERRTELAYQLAGAHHRDCLEKIGSVQIAITAVEAVIASGAKEPEAASPRCL
jgi:hypothetical protein